MFRSYTLKSGETIRAFYNTYSEYLILAKDANFDHMVKISDDGSFEYEGEIINIDNFDYIPLNDLIKRTSDKEERKRITENEFLCTLLKESDNIGFLVETEYHTPSIKIDFRLGEMFDYRQNEVTLMIPSEKYYKKEEWDYKIVLTPFYKNLPYKERMFYPTDLVHLIRLGEIQVVHLDNYRQKENKEEGT